MLACAGAPGVAWRAPALASIRFLVTACRVACSQAHGGARAHAPTHWRLSHEFKPLPFPIWVSGENGFVLCGVLGVARSSGHPQRGVLSDYRKNKHIFSMPLPITHIAVLLAIVATLFPLFHFAQAMCECITLQSCISDVIPCCAA